jgi:hypothetical protein
MEVPMGAKWVGLGRGYATLPIFVLVVLAATGAVACGQAESEPTSPPFATAITIPSAEPSAEPPPEPAPTEIAATLDEPTYEVAKEDLPRMILTPSDVSAAIPEIRKQIEDMENLSGGGLSTGRAYIDNDDAAQSSADLLDTAVSLAERGRIIGYRDNFFDASALYTTGDEPAGPFQVFTGVQMFDTAESASEWLKRSFQITRDSVGQTQDRFTLIDVTETTAPDLGDRALILRIVASFSGPPSVDIVTVSVRWRRGPIVAAVQVDTVNSKAYTSAVLQLALGMDARINGVLMGAQ